MSIKRFVFLLVAASAFGQGSRKDDIALKASGAFPVFIPSASVRVCNSGSTGTPCTPTATLYSDATLTSTVGNPVTADAQGNYHIYSKPGRYDLQITDPSSGAVFTQKDVILAPDVANIPDLITSSTPVVDVRAYGGYPSGTLDQWLNAAIAHAIALGGGVVDARGLDGLTETIAAESDIGNSSSVPVALILPHSGNWNVTVNNAASCALKIFNLSSVLGTNSGGIGGLILRVQTGSSMRSVVCTDPSNAGGDYIKAQGFDIHYSSVTATIANALLEETNLVDGSSFRDITVWAQGFVGNPLWVYGTCCTAENQSVIVNCNNTVGCTPLKVGKTGSGTHAISFINSSFTHADSALPLISIDGGASTYSINFYNTHLEANLSIAHTASLVQFTTAGTTGVLFDGISLGQTLTPASSSYIIDIPVGVLGVTAENLFCHGGRCINDHQNGLLVTYTTNTALPFYTSGLSKDVLSDPTSANGVNVQRTVADDGAGGVLHAFEPTALSGHVSEFRWCRQMNNTGGCQLTLYKGDNSSSQIFNINSTNGRSVQNGTGTQVTVSDSSTANNARLSETIADDGSGGAIVNFDPIAIAGQFGQIRICRGVNNSGRCGFNIFKGDGTSTSIFQVNTGTATVSGDNIPILASLTTTAATTDNVTMTGMTSSGHCGLTPTNASAATNIATTFVSAKTTNQITVTHTATASMTYDISCTPN